MMEIKINAEMRDALGTNDSNKVRNINMVPGVIYGKDQDTKHVKLDDKEFRKTYRDAGVSTIIGLTVEGEELPVIIKEVQKDPIKDLYLHVDFQKVSMDEKIRVILPITLLNRDDIKIQPSILAQQLDEIEIECLPGDLPEEIEIDVHDMEIGDSITVADLEIAKNEDITVLRDLDDVICSLSEFIEEDLDEEVEVDMDVEPELVSDSEEEETEEEE